MEQVAHMLGIELGEEFLIKEIEDSKYKLTMEGIFYYDDIAEAWLESSVRYDITETWIESALLYDILKGELTIIKKTILNEAERKYLSNVIKPFREQVDDIGKLNNGTYEYIAISLRNIDGYTMIMYFPRFKTGTMYKGMKAGKKYTLENLGL